VSCASASACTAVGSYSTDEGRPSLTLAERWNGTEWSIQKTPKPTNGSARSLHGVSCVSASVCTAVGSYYNGTTDVALAERWNGTGWSIQRTSNPTGGSGRSLHGVSCVSASACTAVGNYFNGSAQVTLAERWNGTKWSTQHTPNPTDASDKTTLGGVSCASGSACTAVGDYVRGVPYVYVTLAERWTG
jgi:hypothetical protein